MNSSGIYMIFNMKTEDYYIGSTSISFKRRLTQHLSDLYKKKHRNIHLQRAYDKYGWESFYFIILEINELNIIEREQWYLDNWNPRYNIATVAENSGKGRKMSEEQRQKLREIHLGSIAWNRGLKFSEESRRKMSEAKLGKPSPVKGISTQKYNPVKRSDGKVYNSPKEAADELKVKPNTVIKAISDTKIKRSVKGFYFEYLDKPEDPMEGIRKCQRGYSVYYKKEYLGYKTNLEEAIELRMHYKSEKEELPDLKKKYKSKKKKVEDET